MRVQHAAAARDRPRRCAATGCAADCRRALTRRSPRVKRLLLARFCTLRAVYESRFAKVALVKAQRQSERDSAQAERDELHAGAWRSVLT